MIESSSSFLTSSIPLYHNAFKSIIFRGAELLMGFFIYKLFSLIAARSNHFTSYLMFAEDYIQRLCFVSSRGFSQAGILVLVFTILNILASMYGTLLWALDSPGYIFRASDATVADYQDHRNENAPYIVQLYLDPKSLKSSSKTLANALGSDMFDSSINCTLTGQVDRGTPTITKPTRKSGVGPRIWLDDDGFSVTPDTLAMYPTNMTLEGKEFPINCIGYGGGLASWDCTFDNVFAMNFMSTVTGRPEVHWDDKSDLMYNSRYISPSRVDNIWYTFGAGAGSAAMMQVFTVTKATKRHTFIQSTSKTVMMASPDAPFIEKEVRDLIQRNWSSNETERTDPLLEKVTQGMMAAQSKGKSYQMGAAANDNGNFTVLQYNWGLFTATSSGQDLFSLMMITTTNITLIRSETISKAPIPFGTCSHSSFQNEAFGGKVTETDCAGSRPDTELEFFGQVDTSAVLITHGLGDIHANTSSGSLNSDVLAWLRSNSDRMESLLIAKAYSVSINPSLVTLSVDILMVAISGMQLFLSCLAVGLVLFSWFGLSSFADAHWSNSFLANIVHSTAGIPRGPNPGYMYQPPEISLSSQPGRKSLRLLGKDFRLYDSASIPMQTTASQIPESYHPEHHQSTQYQPTPYEPTQYQPTQYQSTEYQSTQYQSTLYQSTPYQSTPYQSTSYQPAPDYETGVSSMGNEEAVSPRESLLPGYPIGYSKAYDGYDYNSKS